MKPGPYLGRSIAALRYPIGRYAGICSPIFELADPIIHAPSSMNTTPEQAIKRLCKFWELHNPPGTVNK